MKRKKPKKTRKDTRLHDKLKADATAMKSLLRSRGRDPDWIEENYPNDYSNQCYILHGLLAQD